MALAIAGPVILSAELRYASAEDVLIVTEKSSVVISQCLDVHRL